jgi:dTDP-glucose 4,6-dehydratase
MPTVLVTGGAGFIGSNFIHFVLAKHPDYRIINLDKLTYAGNLSSLREVADDERYRFVHGDICDPEIVGEVMQGADAVVSFAAESHVDRSILDPSSFIMTNVYGTFTLLEAARVSGIQKFVQISTDEVYGPMPAGRSAKETDVLHPRSPYSAAKVGSEMQCLAFFETYRLPVLITRGSNTVGPHQYPEKLVPLFATNALNDEPLPVYGDGNQVRDWLHVEDHCAAIDLLLEQGEPGEVYNIGAGNERPNLDVVDVILSTLDKPASLVRHVRDRPGHDVRYSVETVKLRSLGWEPRFGFKEALEHTVRWYADNQWWWEPIRSGEFRQYYLQQYGDRLTEAVAE